MQTPLGKNRRGDAILAQASCDGNTTARFIRTAKDLLAFIDEEYIDDLGHPEAVALIDRIGDHDWEDSNLLTLEFEDGWISFADVFAIDRVQQRLVSGLQEILWQCSATGEAYEIASDALLDAGMPLSRYTKPTTDK